jgi:hypothetical protein
MLLMHMQYTRSYAPPRTHNLRGWWAWSCEGRHAGCCTISRRSAMSEEQK